MNGLEVLAEPAFPSSVDSRLLREKESTGDRTIWPDVRDRAGGRRRGPQTGCLRQALSRSRIFLPETAPACLAVPFALDMMGEITHTQMR